MTREELLDALTAERYDNRWWTTKPTAANEDEVTCARRRRELVREDGAA